MGRKEKARGPPAAQHAAQTGASAEDGGQIVVREAIKNAVKKFKDPSHNPRCGGDRGGDAVVITMAPARCFGCAAAAGR